MSKVYAVPMTLYVKAPSKKRAKGLAELSAHVASERLRYLGKKGVKHSPSKTMSIRVSGKPQRVAPSILLGEDYDPKILKKVFGDAPIIWLAHHASNIWP